MIVRKQLAICFFGLIAAKTELVCVCVCRAGMGKEEARGLAEWTGQWLSPCLLPVVPPALSLR